MMRLRGPDEGGGVASRSESVEQQPQPRLQAEWGNLIQGRFEVRSDGSSHQHVGTEPRAAKRGYGLEPLLREHGCSAMFGLISESARFPASDGIGLHEAPSLVSCGFQSGFQQRARYPAFAILPVNNEASYSPKFRATFGSKPSILATVVDPRKLFSGAVLAPSDGLPVRVDKDSMRASPLEEFSLFAAVPDTSFSPGIQPLVLGQPVRPVKMHAPTKVPAAPLREKSLKIWPSLL